jgi:hypothetical protein
MQSPRNFRSLYYTVFAIGPRGARSRKDKISPGDSVQLSAAILFLSSNPPWTDGRVIRTHPHELELVGDLPKYPSKGFEFKECANGLSTGATTPSATSAL